MKFIGLLFWSLASLLFGVLWIFVARPRYPTEPEETMYEMPMMTGRCSRCRHNVVFDFEDEDGTPLSACCSSYAVAETLEVSQ